MKKIKKTFKYLLNWLKDCTGDPNGALKPTVLNIPVTDNCNARCVMCDVWVENSLNEMKVKDYARVFSDDLFSEVRHVGLSGGEPTLRNDLIKIVKCVVEKFPYLESLSLTSHGYQVSRHKKMLPVINKICISNDIAFTLNISIDGIEELHNEVRRVPRGFTKAKETINLAKNKLGITVQLQCTVSAINTYGVGYVRYFANKNDLDVVFRVATEIKRLSNTESVNSVLMSLNQKSFLSDFLNDNTTMLSSKSLGRRMYYQFISEWLISGGERKMPCYFKKQGLLLAANADSYMCSVVTEKFGNMLSSNPSNLYFNKEAHNIRENAFKDDCLKCIHDQSGAWSPFSIIKFKILNTSLYQAFLKTLTAINYFMFFSIKLFLHRKPDISNNIKSIGINKALIIGCYGGEHVGDAAILGGVILRNQERYSCDKYVIASIREDRTRRWVRALDLNCDISVVDYRPENINITMDIDAIIIAGGPLMDLPSLLMKHFSIIKKAFKHNIPLIIDGVGIGPFRFKFSKYVVDKILSFASYVRVRTTKAQSLCKMKGLEVEVDRDPAFDYIDYIKSENKISIRCTRLAKVLESNKNIIALNIRPLWNRYATKDITQQYIDELENTVVTELAKFINLLDDESIVVFYPMNADQFGFSDLEIAYRINDQVKNNKLFIWEYEPDIDEVCYLLSKSAYSIAMRFHACIFSLAMGAKTIGIDYGIGKESKVTELFEDADSRDNVVNVEGLTCDYLTRTVVL